MERRAYEQPRLELIDAYGDIRAESTSYSVIDPSGNHVGGGDVVEHPDVPSSWWDNPDNWGGD